MQMQIIVIVRHENFTNGLEIGVISREVTLTAKPNYYPTCTNAKSFPTVCTNLHKLRSKFFMH